jgi:hypothetical protein
VTNTSGRELELSALADPGCSAIVPAAAQRLAAGASATFNCQHTLAGVGAYAAQASIEGRVDGGQAVRASNTLEVAVARRALLISALKQSHASWREADKRARVSRREPLGTTFSFSLNAAATVTFTFTRTVPGRMVGRSCRAPSKHNATHRACRRTVVAGVLRFSGRASTNKVAFYGLLPARRKLPPGRYALRVSATSSGSAAKSQVLHFTILGR